MPASVDLRDGKWRVVEPSGKVVTNKGGTAVDGGGHTSKDRAIAQAAAINLRVRKTSVPRDLEKVTRAKRRNSY